MNAQQNPFKAKYETTTELKNGRFTHTLVVELIDEDFTPTSHSGIAIPKRNTLKLDLSSIEEAQAQANKIRKDLQS